jgi:hypothetical protein
MRWLRSLLLTLPAAVLAAHCGSTIDGNIPPGGKIPKDHRTEGSACPTERPPSMPRGAADAGGADAGDVDAGEPTYPGECLFDEDCTEGKNGRCVKLYYVGPGGGAPYPGPTCTYDQCVSDADCSDGPCVCSSLGNLCMQGNCKTDADCGPGGYCSPSMLRGLSSGSFCGVNAQQGWYCHTSKDECVNDADCKGVDAGPWSSPPTCGYVSAEKRWRCVSVTPCAG